MQRQTNMLNLFVEFRLRKSQVFTTFELLHQDLKRQSEIQHLATTYVNSFKPSLKDFQTLKSVVVFLKITNMFIEMY